MGAEPDPEDVAAYFTEESTSPIHHDDSRELLVALATGNHLADIGCGDGTLTKALADEYPDADVWAIDRYTGAAEEHLSADGYEHVSLQQEDVFDEYPVDTFDTVYAINFLPATEQPQRAASLLRDGLQDGGHLIVTLPGLEDDDLQQIPDHHRGEDSETGLPYVCGTVEFEDTTIPVQQYVFPDDTADELFDRAGLTVDTTGELAVDPAAAQRLQQYLEVDQREMFESVDLYVLTAGDSDDVQ